MRKYGLIGKTLDHSWSKAYFEQKFIRENINDCVYENFPLADLNKFHDLLIRESSLSGLNITNPYKIEVLRYLDEIDPVAEAVGAANCLKIFREDDLIHIRGYNTDMMAFRDTIRPLINESSRKALVLGTGGAARAVCLALLDLNIEHSMVSRKEKAGVLNYSEINGDIIAGHQIIINATPAGMFPNQDHCPPLPYSYLTGYHLLYDLVYNPEETLFLKKGADAGARVKNGLEMLQVQAELSWKVWNSSKCKVQSAKL